MTIRNYDEFIAALLKAGFSGAVGGRDEGVFDLFRYGWGADDEGSAYWHSGDPDSDPWEWRVRVMAERRDITYSKAFFRKAGYITREWYPYFLAARRGGMSFEEEYREGTVSHFAKRAYEAAAAHGSLPAHEIKRAAGVKREDASKFDSALTELQMRLYLTMCGTQPKISREGKEYGWSSMVFCTTEHFWGGRTAEVFGEAASIGRREAAQAITEQILSLNPSARLDKIGKFIRG